MSILIEKNINDNNSFTDMNKISDKKEIVTCKNCGNEFIAYKSVKRIYCSKRCSVEAQKGFVPWNKGKKGVMPIPWNKGKKWSEETKRKISESLKGRYTGKNHPMYGRKHSNKTRQKIRETQMGKKLSEEHKRKLSESLKGEKNHFFGKKFSEGHKQKLSNAKKISWQNDEYRKMMSESHKGKFVSEETRRKLSESHSGSNNYNWKGGHIGYYGPNWYQQRRFCLERDNNTCQICGKTKKENNNRNMDVHHVIPLRNFGLKKYLEANKISNLICLCKGCHPKVENGIIDIIFTSNNKIKQNQILDYCINKGDGI